MRQYEIISTISSSNQSTVSLVDIGGGQLAILKERKYADYVLLTKLKTYDFSFAPKLYEIEINKDKTLILEEYISGQTLRALLDSDNFLGDDLVHKILMELCYALKSLHNCNPPIIFRDLKPDNVMLADDGRVILIDFDTAREFDVNDSTDTVHLGTREYAAPEQYGFQQTDSRSDIYSFGIVMSEISHLGHVSKEYESFLEKIIRKATMFSPEDRYNSLEQMEKQLASKTPTSLAKRKTKTIIIASVIAFVLGIAIGYVVGHRNNTNNTKSVNISDKEIPTKETETTTDINKETTTKTITYSDGDQMYQEYNYDTYKFCGYPDDAQPEIVELLATFNGMPVTRIDDYALCGRDSVTKCIIPEGYIEIGMFAFADCASIESITIPESVKYIDLNAFSDCGGLTIKTTKDSYAYEFAMEHDINVEIIE